MQNNTCHWFPEQQSIRLDNQIIPDAIYYCPRQIRKFHFLFLFQAMDGKVHFVYKKVAMVEQFFDIIYSVHVEAAGDTQIRGRAGKHCGQKRTYRAVSIR